jgi:hypothetical protein
MADEHPPTRPQGAIHETQRASSGAPALHAVIEGAPDAISEIKARDPQAFEDVLSAVARCRVKKNREGLYEVSKEDLIREYERLTRFHASALVIMACNFFASACKPMVSHRAADILLNRLYGAVKQRVQIEGDANAMRILVEHRSIPLPELVEDERSAAS